MPIDADGPRAVLHGHCRIEEAETLLDWALRHPEGEADLSQCRHLHSAVLQTLLAIRPRRIVPPQEPWLAALLAGHSPLIEETPPCNPSC
ncbi:hypothetical protein [Chitinimonas lacunae]|uniref:Uncharacterized protein n=1 Tax=Chitinimonas lacunae TaxID=1963018 RepID=A0ABV8MLC6_9NEIS